MRRSLQRSVTNPIPRKPAVRPDGLLFTGLVDGSFAAYDDTSLEQLWEINVGPGFGPPMTFEFGGKQYVAILTGTKAALVRELRSQTMLFVVVGADGAWGAMSEAHCAVHVLPRRDKAIAPYVPASPKCDLHHRTRPHDRRLWAVGQKGRRTSTGDVLMRKVLKSVRLAALAGAVVAAGAVVSHRADAMTFSTPAGVLAAAPDEGTQVEQVRWCGWRGCWGVWRPRYYGYYVVRPYWGWGHRRWWW